MQALVARSGCMDVLHALEAALARLPAAPAASLAASAPHACAAVDAVSDLDTRFLRAVLSLLHLVLVCGSADGTPLQTHHHTRVRVLLARAHGLALAAETARFLVAAPAAAPAAEPSLEMLQLSDAPLGSPRTPQPGTAGSLLVSWQLTRFPHVRAHALYATSQKRPRNSRGTSSPTHRRGLARRAVALTSPCSG
jgi:hypothetical protein